MAVVMFYEIGVYLEVQFLVNLGLNETEDEFRGIYQSILAH
jgi:hypothetical protein